MTKILLDFEFFTEKIKYRTAANVADQINAAIRDFIQIRKLGIGPQSCILKPIALSKLIGRFTSQAAILLSSHLIAEAQVCAKVCDSKFLRISMILCSSL
jgi:hypothetical protein